MENNNEVQVEELICGHCDGTIDPTREYAVVMANCLYINSDRQAELQGTYYHAECLDELRENKEGEEENNE